MRDGQEGDDRLGEEEEQEQEEEQKIDEGVAGVDFVQFFGDEDGQNEAPKKKKLSVVAKKSGGFQKMGSDFPSLLLLLSAAYIADPLLEFFFA